MKLVLDIVCNHSSPDANGVQGQLFDDGKLIADFNSDPGNWYHHCASEGKISLWTKQLAHGRCAATHRRSSISGDGQDENSRPLPATKASHERVFESPSVPRPPARVRDVDYLGIKPCALDGGAHVRRDSSHEDDYNLRAQFAERRRQALGARHVERAAPFGRQALHGPV
jgi:hypothetical protein